MAKKRWIGIGVIVALIFAVWFITGGKLGGAPRFVIIAEPSNACEPGEFGFDNCNSGATAIDAEKAVSEGQCDNPVPYDPPVDGFCERVSQETRRWKEMNTLIGHGSKTWVDAVRNCACLKSALEEAQSSGVSIKGSLALALK